MFPQGMRREGAWGEQVRERSRQAFGREYLKPGCEWLKKLAPLTEKSRGGLQAQLDPGGFLCASPSLGLPSLYTNSSLVWMA